MSPPLFHRTPQQDQRPWYLQNKNKHWKLWKAVYITNRLHQRFPLLIITATRSSRQLLDKHKASPSYIATGYFLVYVQKTHRTRHNRTTPSQTYCCHFIPCSFLLLFSLVLHQLCFLHHERARLTIYFPEHTIFLQNPGFKFQSLRWSISTFPLQYHIQSSR